MVHKGKKLYVKNDKKLNNAPTTSNKKARIIVRNLPFKNLSEESVENFFKEYGDIEEVKLLRKDDGKFLGCGFVQFKKVSSAAKAIRHANEKEMSGRQVVVDWALPKKTFLDKIQKLGESLSVKSEVQSGDDNIEFFIDKKPNLTDSYDRCSADNASEDLKEEDDNESEIENENEDEDDDNDYDDDDDESEDDAKDNDFDEDDDSDDDYENDVDGIMNGKDKFKNNASNIKSEHPHVNSDDVEDGKTVFVRNIAFSATNEDLKNCFESYGSILYALICIDKLTEHSKGTGFVKFKDKESASKCIKDSANVYLHDNPLTITLALSKKDLESKKVSKKTVKDSRNLYLIREGTVIAGSKAATGVSAGDMAKRLQLEQWKNQILKNLNMFVSKTRLVIHNLPPHYDDSKLRNLFQKYSNPKAVIREAKVMYDRKKLDSAGKEISKEVGFVSFTNHEDALEALRNVNNNPEIFTPKKRPIVAFSIENKAALNSKLKRVEKSRIKLGISDEKPDKLSKLNRKQRRFLKRREKFIQRRKELKKTNEKEPSEAVEVEKDKNSKRKRKNSEESEAVKKRKVGPSVQTSNESVQNPFTGVISNAGKKIKLRSKFRLKNQANIHHQTLKKERKKKRERERRNLVTRKPNREKKGKPKLVDDVKLSKLLRKHRESIQESSVIKKWYNN